MRPKRLQINSNVEPWRRPRTTRQSCCETTSPRRGPQKDFPDFRHVGPPRDGYLVLRLVSDFQGLRIISRRRQMPAACFTHCWPLCGWRLRALRSSSCAFQRWSSPSAVSLIGYRSFKADKMAMVYKGHRVLIASAPCRHLPFFPTRWSSPRRPPRPLRRFVGARCRCGFKCPC